MQQVNIHHAKAHLSRLLEKVASGEEIIIARAGKPIARLSPLTEVPTGRVLGQDRGMFEVPEDFDDPLPPEVLEGFTG